MGWFVPSIQSCNMCRFHTIPVVYYGDSYAHAFLTCFYVHVIFIIFLFYCVFSPSELCFGLLFFFQCFKLECSGLQSLSVINHRKCPLQRSEIERNRGQRTRNTSRAEEEGQVLLMMQRNRNLGTWK